MSAATDGVTPFSAADFRLRASREIAEEGEYGDHRLNPALAQIILGADLREAAVLIAAVDRGQDTTLLLTKRNEKLRAHSGQIAFPGGRIDATDASAEAAALREAWEEVGLESAAVEVVGALPPYVTGSGFRVAPVLGIVRPPLALTVNADEVDAVFEVPLRFLMDPANHFRETRFFAGHDRAYLVMPWQDRRIWGITAGIIRMLYERLYA